MPVPGDMPEEIITESGWIIRRPDGEYVLMLDLIPEDWGQSARADVSTQDIRICAARGIKAHLRRIDPRVTTAIVQQHHLKVILGYDKMAPVLNACEIVRRE